MTEKVLEDLIEKDVDVFIKELEEGNSVEDQLKLMLDYMQMQLDHGKVKPLNRFWKMRHFCLKQFKETLPFTKRLHFWELYCQIIKELTRLKQVVDEKVLFSKGEIETAIASIEQDLKQMDSIIAQTAQIQTPNKVPCFAKHEDFYQEKQKELNVVNAYAKQLNALKNETLNLEIAYRDKQALLGKLHELSDIVFPNKRELLTAISKMYSDDIHSFIRLNFEKKELKLPLFDLKDQIKELQAFAKVLTLNVATFSQSREKLSQAWDLIRNFEKEQKKLKEQQKLLFNENEGKLTSQIQALKDKKESLSKKDFDKEIHQIGEAIKKAELQKAQRKKLKELLDLLDENSALREGGSEEEDSFIQIQRDILHISEKASHWDFFTLMNEYKRVQNLFESSKVLDVHQNKILRRLFSIKDLLMNKLLEEVENSVDIEDLTQQIEGFKKELQGDMEKYRRALNTSNQSIEKAMLYNELLTQSKLKLSEFNSKVNPSLSS